VPVDMYVFMLEVFQLCECVCAYVVCVYERENGHLIKIGMYIAVKYLSIQMGLFCVQIVQWLWHN